MEFLQLLWSRRCPLVNTSQTNSLSELLSDWRFTADQFILAPSPLRLTTSKFFQLNTCSHSRYVTSSLMRGLVYRLQLMLVLASAVILGSESRGNQDHILVSQIRDSPNLEGQVPVFISPRNRVAQLYPQALGSLFVPPTTRRTTVEAFEPVASVLLITSRDGPHRKHRFKH
jgi:hypothetical protein